MNNKRKLHKINQEIRATEVRVTGDGVGGVMPLADALSLAQSKDMDLVLLNENTQPPVCKVVKYEKMLYEQNKKPKNKPLEMKEIKIGPNTSENDLDYRRKHIIEFLKKGHQVRITLQFRGREMAFIDRGRESMLKLVLSLSDYGVPDSMPDMEGKKMFTTLRPKK